MAVTESLAVKKGDGGKHTQDDSVDPRGNPVPRSKRDGWTACSFIVVYELFERMAYRYWTFVVGSAIYSLIQARSSPRD